MGCYCFPPPDLLVNNSTLLKYKTNYMKPFVYRIAVVLSLLTFGFFTSQATTLGLGDIAITGYNGDNPDEFSFVLLEDISGTTVISFTDGGWLAAGGFRAGEGTIRLTISGAQSCGTEILVSFATGTWAASIGTVATAGGSLQLSSSGDQIFAYNGTTAPTLANQTAFITGLHYAGATYNADATGSVESAQPPVFASNPGNDFAVAHLDNGKYGCNLTSGLAADLRASIYNASNWSFSNSSTARFDLVVFCNFSCSAACTDPVITSLTTNSTIGSNTFCPGDNVIITITGTANDATEWKLYAGNSCGGTALQTIPVSQNTFNVTASSTTTYSIAGIGGCVSTPTACTAITITVNGLTANAGSNQKISGSTTANISGNGSGTWSIVGVGDGSGLFAGATTTSTNPTTTFTGTAGQEYTLRWTVTNAGCPSSSADVTITFLSPTTLGLGDIAFTGYNSDNPDEFRFVLLKDINAGTQITFTDNGWLSAGGFRGGENTITYMFCRPYSCGDEFSATSGVAVKDDGGSEAAPILSGTSPALATGGDQIFAYQGAAPTTGGASNWIAAIQMNGAWDANAIDAETSARPSAFTDGVNSISISPEVDNAKYDCSITTNSPANLAAAVNTASNWTTQGGILALDFCSFTCGSCVEPALTSVSAPSTACPSQTVALTINGTLNGANEWAIYTGSCGGTLVGTTTSSSFNVTPTATTTYYVSGRGGCVVTESCQTATISVTSIQSDAGPNDVEKLNGGTFTTLQGNGGFGDGTWTFVDPGDGQGSFSDINNPAATFSGTAGQSYTLKWTIDNSAAGCPDTDDEVTIVFLSQTGLALGDIAFIAYSADQDDVAFVVLKDITAGTSIKFTDNGWQSAGGFRSGEGTRTLEFCRPYSCGDEFNVFDFGADPTKFFDANGAEAGDITGTGGPIDLSTSGDQLFAYQGNAPTSGNESAFIAAIQMNSASGWDTDATTSNTSAKPSVFTDGVNSISISPEVDNAYLDCSKVGTGLPGPIINTASNWTPNDGTAATLPLNCNLVCCTPGVVNNINGSTGPLCPSSLQTLSVPAQASLNDDQSWVWYTGSCGGTQVSTGPNFNVSPTVTTTYYVRAEGTCSGTSGACAEITITVEDNVPPDLACPLDIMVGNDPGLCSAVVNFAATASDNCGGDVDITYSQNPGSVFPRGTTLVNVTAKDESGKQKSCSFNVTVNDTEAPTAVCPGTIFDVELDLMGNGTLPANIGDGNSTDNCGSIETSPELNFTCDDLGIQTVTLTANDLSGGISTIDCSFNVVDNVGACCTPGVVNNINGSTGPLCPSSLQTLSVPAQASLNDDQSWVWYTGSCGGTQVSTGPNFNVSPTVTTTYYVRAEGTCSGTSGACAEITITVEDNVPPDLSCPLDIMVGNDPGLCSAVGIFVAIALDNCGGNVDITYSQNPGTTFNVGTTTVDVMATDESGNKDNCSFDITVTDNEDPVFSNCPGNISVGNDPGVCGAVVNWTPPTLSDNCPGVSSNSSHIPGVGFPVGSTNVVYIGSDAAGNDATNCSFVVTVNDTEDPVFSNCPGNISVSNDSGQCGADVAWTPPTLSDNCPAVSSNSSHNSGDFFPVGSTTVTYSGSDAAGNNASNCSFVVTVNDTENPTIICPSGITVSNDAGNCSAVVNIPDPTLGDNCPNPTFAYSPMSGSTFNLSTTTVTAIATDAAGNTAQCTLNITVNDTEDPTFSNCPGNINVFNDQGDCGALVNWTPPAFEDNCPGATSDSSHDPGDFFPVGSTTVTYTGKDAAGNTATDCSFTIAVTDNEKPSISCPANISMGTDDGECGAEVTFTPAIASDNCTVQEVKARYRPVDQNNSALGGWSNRVFDPSGFFPVGRYQVQWRAKDIYGNKRTCSHFLEVFDDENPVAVCKDVTVDFNGQQDINLTVAQVWDEAASSDNCDLVTYVGTSPGLTIDCDDLGNTIALTVTIEDEAGNEDDCTSYVEVIGLPCGWAEGPQDGSLNCDGDTSSDYDTDDESFTLTADGCWHDCREPDRAVFVYHPLCGDGTLTARLADINYAGYAGLMARESLDPEARRAGVLKNYSTRRVRREWRASYGGIVSQSNVSRSRVEWLRIVRKGNEIKSYTSSNGSYWRLLYKVTYSNLEDCIYLGMTAYSSNGSSEVEAVFDNVSISASGSLAGGLIDDTILPTELQGYSTVNELEPGDINIFPNPASQQAQILLDGFQDQPALIVVRDKFGRMIRQIQLDTAIDAQQTLDLTDFAAGVYIVSIIQDQQIVATKKLIVQP